MRLADLGDASEEFACIGIGKDPGIGPVRRGHDADCIDLARTQHPAPCIRPGIAQRARGGFDLQAHFFAHDARPIEDIRDRGL